MQTVPYILGIAHTTGYPAFTVAGWMLSHILAFGAVAWRMNLISALYLAGACWFIFQIQLRLAVSHVIALLSVLVFATGPIVWFHAIRVDVISLTVLLAAAVVFLLVSWRNDRRDAYLFLACLLLGFGLGNHLVIVWLIPACLLLVSDELRYLGTRRIVQAILLFLLGTSIYAYLPLRSVVVTANRYDRTLALGIPPGHPYWDYAHPATMQGFLWLVTGSQVKASNALASMIDVRTVLTGVQHFSAMCFYEFSVLGIIALIAGLAVGIYKQPVLTWATLIACVLVAWFAAAFTAESDPDRYFIMPFALLTPFIGVGSSQAVRLIKQRRLANLLVCLVLLAVTLAGVYRTRAVFGWRTDRWGITYIDRVRAATPNNAIVIAPWVLATPLAYAAYVERSMGDRIVETGRPLDDSAYLKEWLKVRPIYVVLDTAPPPGYRLSPIDRRDPPIYRLLPLTSEPHRRR